jgi:hypothetical protein
VDLDSAVCIAPRYRLDGPEIKSRWVARFSIPVHTCLRAQPASCTMGTGPFPGVKRPGCGVDHLPNLVPKLKNGFSYTFALPLGLHGLFQDELTFASRSQTVDMLTYALTFF